MADDTTTKPKEEEVVETPSPEVPPEEVETKETPAEEAPSEPESPETPEEPEQPPEEAPQEESPQEAPEDKPPSRREQLRIQQLLKKYGPPQERPQSPQERARQNALNYEQALETDPDTIRRLNEDRQAAEEVAFNRGAMDARQETLASEWRTNLKIDFPLVKDKLEKLDSVDVQALDEEYLSYVGFDPRTGYVSNPQIGYADFVEARIEQAERLAERMNAKSAKNIAQQSAQTGLRPDGSSAKRLDLSKAPEDMTDEELDAAIKANMRGKHPV